LDEAPGNPQGVTEEDQSRAELYGLLAWLLRAPLTRDDLDRLGEIDGGDSDLGEALGALAAAARAATPEQIGDEYQNLFIGVGRGELMPFASYYLTGFLNEKPLAKLRVDMGKLGITRADDVGEPEDHMAALCEMMAGLITGAFGEAADLAAQQRFFDDHIAPWAEKFFADLEAAKGAGFFMPVGAVGKQFMAIEAQAFEMAA
jgi:TorA maturation chaperone TorD